MMQPWGTRPPVQVEEKRTEGRELSVKVPAFQAAWMGVSLALAVLASLLAPLLFGQRIFYFVTGCAALAAFLWSLMYEVHWIERLSMPLLVGVVAWCFWAFTDTLGWTVAESWQPFSVIISVVFLVFSWAFAGALWLAFLQELAYRSPFQEKSLFEALGNLLEKWGEKRIDTPKPEPVSSSRLVVEVQHKNDNGVYHQISNTPPVTEKQFYEVCEIIASGKTFTEANLCGTDKPLRGRKELLPLQEWFIEHEYASWKVSSNGKPERRQGIKFEAAGLAIIEQATTPPQRCRKRSGGGVEKAIYERTNDERTS